MKRPLLRWGLIFVFLSLTATPVAVFWSSGLSPSPVVASQSGPSCQGDSQIVVKPVPGIDDNYLNAKYGTQTVRKFYGTDIWVLEPPAARGAKRIVKQMLRSRDVVWAEAGQFSQTSVLPTMVSPASLNQSTQATLDQFSAASLDQFSAAILDQFSTAMLDQFSVAMLDQFTTAALDQFTTAALDQFTTAMLDQFSASILDQFSAAILDQFGQAALDQFTAAVLDQFTTAALDRFSTAILDQFSAATLDQFNQAVLDQFSAAALDQFSAAVMDQFSSAILDQFNQAALDQFSVAALDQFSIAVMDQFSIAVLDQFSAAILDQFSNAALDQFSAAVLDQFSAAIMDQFSTASLDQFTQSALDQFSAAIMDQFSAAIMDQFSTASLDQFTQSALDQFSQSALDQFSKAALDQFIQSVLDQFDAAYFENLIVSVLDSVYGAAARNQEAVAAIRAPLANAYATGAGVTVAVIDSGIRDHWFLNGRIAPGGWDFVDGDNDPTDEIASYDPDGDGVYNPGWSHGTHVAGIISLVAPDAKILPIRVQGGDGGAWSFIVAEAIEYAVDAGADVINLSLGVPCKSNDLKWAMKYAENNNVTVVAAAGNDNEERLHYPAGYSNGIGVAATDDLGVRAPFSNYSKKVTIAAPGVNIYSTYGEGQFAWWSGTSQAAPMVAGEAALIRSIDPNLKAKKIRNIIKKSGKNIDAENPDMIIVSHEGSPGKYSKLGGGLADALNGLNMTGVIVADEAEDITSTDYIYSPDTDSETVDEYTAVVMDARSPTHTVTAGEKRGVYRPSTIGMHR